MRTNRNLARLFSVQGVPIKSTFRSNRLIVLTLGATLGTARGASAQETHTFYGDRHMSVVAGVSTVQTARHVLGEFQDRVIPSRPWSQGSFGGKLGGVLFRMVKIGLIDTPQDVLESTLSHEVFGHGARAREFGLSVSYNIELPPPFGDGGGSTTLANVQLGVDFSPHEELAITIAGIETSNVGWSRLADRWIDRGTFNYREALQFVTAHLSALVNTVSRDGSDGEHYTIVLNAMRLENGDARISAESIESRIRVNLLNPFFGVALYRSVVTYLFTGREDYSMPMISFGEDVRYMGWPRYVLTPFGPEWGIEHLLVREGQQLRLGFRISDGLGASTWGGGVRVQELARRGRYSIGGRIELWGQPGFELLGRGLRTRAGGLGAALVGTVRFTPEFMDRGAVGWSIVGDIGYKAAGYLEGEALDRGLVLRFGGAFRGF